MNLLEKAKVITTPTAYSDGILHSVKPNVVLGEELVVNGDFSDGTNDWSPNPNSTLSIDDGRLKVSISGAGSGYPSQYITTEVGKTYKVIADGFIGTSSRLALYNSADGVFSNLYADGSLDFTFVATSTSTQLRLYVYDDGAYGFWDNVSVKEKLDADFTFTRNSSATRVGADGYIQDVQIIGGELVQNGDFEQIGSEEVTNGDFSDGSLYWTSGGLVTFADGKASFVDNGTNTYSFIAQTVFTASKTYKIEINISRLDGGQVEVLASGGTIGLFSDEGIKTIYHTASAGDILIKRYSASPNFDFDIDNVSVKEVGQNWTFGTGWSIANVNGNQVAISDGSQTAISNLSQSNVTTIGKKYRLTFTVSSISGAVELKGNAVYVRVDNLGIGTHTLDIIADASYIRFLTFAGSTITINNLSVKEVTDDTNLPRINYEGFSYENGLPIYGSGKGHFLLEGQSTNLVTYSEDFSGYTNSNSTDEANATISPSGVENATSFLEVATTGQLREQSLNKPKT